MPLQRTDWDAIVIGGGPAGSTAARYAAEGGAEVLVIDGRDPIGSPLQCGELVPSNDEMRRLCPDVPDIDDLLRTSEHAISLRTTEMHLVPPSGKSLRYPFEGLVLNRVAHDEDLVKLALSSGAEYLVGTRVAEIDSNTVTLADGSQFTAKVIIGAGGHNDPLRKSHWDVDSLNIPVKFVLMDGVFSDALELHFGSVAPGGYAWAFPKQGGANIGLGIQRRLAKGKSLNRYSEEFFSRYEGKISFRERKSPTSRGRGRNGPPLQRCWNHDSDDWGKNRWSGGRRTSERKNAPRGVRSEVEYSDGQGDAEFKIRIQTGHTDVPFSRLVSQSNVQQAHKAIHLEGCNLQIAIQPQVNDPARLWPSLGISVWQILPRNQSLRAS